MATQNSTMTGLKPSFATIAAMAAPAKTKQAGGTIKPTDASPSGPLVKRTLAGPENLHTAQMQRDLQTSISRLTVKESTQIAIVNHNQETNVTVKAGHKLDDDQTQVSSTSTKPASLDGKSATSGTAFALDEKESLRPDDSASVKAAEEEDFYSGPASGTANSRVGSEAGSRAFRDQFYEISERIGPSPHRSNVITRRVIPGILEEGQQVSLAPLVPLIASNTIPGTPAITTNGPSFTYQYQEPDEKLFEALESPKDRFFLLQLEETIIKFVQDSTEPIIDLPSCHSFYRLLTHKLADYYALTHFVDNAVSAVRLYRTPYCRIPTPLSAIPRVPVTTDHTPASQPAVKIMRRAGLGKDRQPTDSGPATNNNSIIASKSGSEAGDGSQQDTGVVSPTDSCNAKDKASMTREEREAKYRETRERIFKGFENSNEDGDAAAVNVPSNEVSRASSANEKKKTKKHRNNDDGFHARSQYNAYYPSLQYPTTTFDQTGNSAAYFSPYGPQQSNVISPSSSLTPPMYQQGYNQAYHTMPSASAYTMIMQQSPLAGGSNMPGQHNNFAVYNQHTPQQYYQPIPPTMAGQHSPARSSPSLSSNAQLSHPQPQMVDQPWPQNSYSYPYQQPRDQQPVHPLQMQDRPSPSTLPTIPYQYGQLPYQSHTPGGKAPHPLPGSYNRQAFNPQTRSFVPSTGYASPQTTSYGSRPMSNGSQNQSYVQQTAAYIQPSLTPTMPFMSPMPGPNLYAPISDPRSHATRKTSSQTNDSQSPGHSSLSKWGTPAHLPPKPPPPDVRSMPESQHSLPTNIHASMNLQAMGNGQSMPSYQNGVYSMPGQGGN